MMPRYFTSVIPSEYLSSRAKRGMTTRTEHVLNPSRRGHNFVGRILHSVGHHEVESRLHQNLLALVHVGSFKPQHDGKLDVSLLRRLHNPGGQSIDAQNAAKNVDQHRFHALIAEQDFEW